jgi:hypothetical protein
VAHAAACPAVPAIALENLAVHFAVALRIQSKARLFAVSRFHANSQQPVTETLPAVPWTKSGSGAKSIALQQYLWIATIEIGASDEIGTDHLQQ